MGIPTQYAPCCQGWAYAVMLTQGNGWCASLMSPPSHRMPHGTSATAPRPVGAHLHIHPVLVGWFLVKHIVGFGHQRGLGHRPPVGRKQQDVCTKGGHSSCQKKWGGHVSLPVYACAASHPALLHAAMQQGCTQSLVLRIHVDAAGDARPHAPAQDEFILYDLRGWMVSFCTVSISSASSSWSNTWHRSMTCRRVLKCVAMISSKKPHQAPCSGVWHLQAWPLCKWPSPGQHAPVTHGSSATDARGRSG